MTNTKKKAGKATKYRKNEVIYDSAKQASAAEGIDYDTLLSYKARGCPAFRNGRVYRDELRVWAQGEAARIHQKRQSAKTLDDQFNERWLALCHAQAGCSVFLQQYPDLFPKASKLIRGELLEVFERISRALYADYDNEDAPLTFLPHGKR